MLRLIGILTGSALAVAVLIMALGPPQFSPPEERSRAHDAEPPAAVDTLIAPAEAAPNTAEPAAPVEKPLDESVDGPVDALVPDADTEALIDEMFAPQSQPAALDTSPADAALVDEKWYAFWSPFRSEIAANGFIARLQETTGIDYRVVKVKTGVYEVAFAYVDDADIRDKLARISDATGLDMTGG